MPASKLVRELADTTCSVILIPDVFTFNILHSRIEEMNGIPVVPLYDTPLSGINRLLKRAEDIVLASLILLLISPVLWHSTTGKTDLQRTGDFPPDSLWHGWEADQSLEVSLNESDGKRCGGDAGHAKRSARYSCGEFPASDVA